MFVAIKQFGGKDRLFAANRQNKRNKKRERRFSDTFSKVIPIIFPESQIATYRKCYLWNKKIRAIRGSKQLRTRSVPTPYFAQCLLNTRPMLVQSKELDELCIKQMRLSLQTLGCLLRFRCASLAEWSGIIMQTAAVVTVSY